MKRLDALVGDIADDVPVDWQTVDGASASGELVREFRIIAAIGAGRARRRRAATVGPVAPSVRALLFLAAGLAALKLATFVLVLANTPSSSFRVGTLALLAALFGLAGGVLITGGRRDERASALGTLFVVAGAAFVDGYFQRADGTTTLGAVSARLATIPPESFIALIFWAFVWTFPARPMSGLSRRLGAIGLATASVLGLLLFTVNTFRAPLESWAPVLGAPIAALGRYPAGTAFWPLLFGVSLPAFPYLLWKTGERPVEERNRAAFFVAAIVGACLPMVLVVLATPVFPALRHPPIRDWVGIVLYVALGTILPSTTYAVAVRNVMNVQLVIRRAARHALARYAVWGVSVLPLSYFALRLYLGRERAVGDVLSEQGGLLIVSGVGFLALTFRHQLLQGVDRWFQRGREDYSESLTRLVGELDGKGSIRELQAALLSALERTLCCSGSSVLILNDSQTAFVSLDGRTLDLPAASTLAGLVGTTRRELPAGSGPEGPLRLLPGNERDWLEHTGAAWLFPMKGSSGTLLGLLCLAESLQGLPYTERDRAFASALASQVALRIENLSLRQWRREVAADAGAPAIAAPVDWQNEPGMQCPTCLLVEVANARQCRCGAPTVPAAVPALLHGKFRIERVLGSGGMGVVYLAIDTALNRHVAVKALPSVTPGHIARLRHEAKAMASVRHPNLAMIYSIERWRDVPLLVVEYLEGGTLLDALRHGPLSVDDALDLGILLADALDLMHAGGLLHRDIKPSNIGYTVDGVPKLLDFGLAAMLARSEQEPAELGTVSGGRTFLQVDTLSLTITRSTAQRLQGTPLYLSPEALAGDDADASFDLWSLGMVLYEAICGRHPLAGYPAVEAMRRIRSVRLPDVRDFRQDCPARVAAFLNDALSLSKDRRPATAAALRAHLQSIRGISAVGAPWSADRPLY